jgi:hypothetical protein
VSNWLGWSSLDASCRFAICKPTATTSLTLSIDCSRMKSFVSGERWRRRRRLWQAVRVRKTTKKGYCCCCCNSEPNAGRVTAEERSSVA